MQASELVKNNPWLLKNSAQGLKEIITDAGEYKYFCLSNLGHSYANHSAGASIAISDLKRLVGSWELVASWGGLADAKVAVRVSRHKKYLKRAIADVESCQ